MQCTRRLTLFIATTLLTLTAAGVACRSDPAAPSDGENDAGRRGQTEFSQKPLVAAGWVGFTRPTGGEFGPMTPYPMSLHSDLWWPTRTLTRTVASIIYLVSSDGALNVLDASAGASPPLVGRLDLAGSPTRLELVGNHAIVVSSVRARQAAVTVVTRVDVSSPNALRIVDQLEVDGHPVDMQRRGAWLHMVSRTGSTSTLSAIDVSAADLTVASTLTFEDQKSNGPWWQAVFAFEGDRLYVATPQLATSGSTSKIEVVDLSSSPGKPVLGATLTVKGAVLVAREIDEHQGVLFVVGSVVPDYDPAAAAPTLQAFAVASAEQVEARGTHEITLPEGAFFADAMLADGLGFLVARRGDGSVVVPLLLSDPEVLAQGNPVEVGNLRDLVWRGDRMSLLSDDDKTGRAQRLSWVDISNAAKPAVLSSAKLRATEPLKERAEPRIVTTGLDDGLVTVTWNAPGSAYCCERVARMQVFSVQDDTLIAGSEVDTRGVVEMLRDDDDVWLGISAEGLTVLSKPIDDELSKLAEIALSHDIRRTALVGASILRFGGANLDLLDLVPTDAAALPSAKMFRVPSGVGGDLLRAHRGQVLNDESRAYVLRSEELPAEKLTETVVTVDLSEPRDLRVLGMMEIDTPDNGSVGVDQSVLAGSDLVLEGTSLLRLGCTGTSADGGGLAPCFLDVIDLSRPSAGHLETLDLPTLASGFVGTPSAFAIGHSESKGDVLRYYVSEVDASAPRAPRLREAINVPGVLVAYAQDQARAITLETSQELRENVTRDECKAHFGEEAGFTPDDSTRGVDMGTCVKNTYQVHQLGLADGNARIEWSAPLPADFHVYRTETDGHVVAAMLSKRSEMTPHTLMLVSALWSKEPTLAVLDLGASDYGILRVHDGRVWLGGNDQVVVVDATKDGPKMTVVQPATEGGQHLTVSKTHAYLSKSTEGVAVLPVPAVP